MPSLKGKFCWISRQTKNGYRLALSVGKKQFNVKGLILKTEEDVNRALKGGVVFVHLSTYVDPKAKKAVATKKAAPRKR
jgi:hypothetical protein